jgi:hypothetical protein
MQTSVTQMKEKVNASEIGLIDSANKIEMITQSTRNYVELIEALNEKVTLHADQVTSTRNAVFKKLSLIEKEILEKLDIDGGV